MRVGICPTRFTRSQAMVAKREGKLQPTFILEGMPHCDISAVSLLHVSNPAAKIMNIAPRIIPVAEPNRSDIAREIFNARPS